GDAVAKRVRVVDRLAVERLDHVAAPDPGVLRRAPGFDAAHDGAAHLLDAEALSEVRRQWLNRHAELRASDTTFGPQSVRDVPLKVGGNREADADVPVGHGEDLGVDADQLALRVHERTTGVAVIDRRVGLKEILVSTVADPRRPTLRADDAHRHGLADAQRIANGEHNVADLYGIGVP